MLIFLQTCGVCILTILGLCMIFCLPGTLAMIVGGILMHAEHGAHCWWIMGPVVGLGLLLDLSKIRIKAPG